jgi:choice-of-anchor A domain-containing protein
MGCYTYFTRTILGAALLACLGSVRALTIDDSVVDFSQDVRNYNLVSLGNASFTNYGDTQGPIAVKGNLSLSGGSIANNSSSFTASSDPTLYVAGQLTLSGSTQLNSGYASTPALTGSWSWNGSQDVLTGGGGSLSSINSTNPLAAVDPRTNPAPTGWNWTSLQSQLVSISQALAAAPATGTIQVSGQTLQLVAPGQPTDGVVIFNLNASLLSGNSYNGQTFTNVQFNIPSNLTFVVNVLNAGGSTLFGTGGGINFNQGSGYQQLLWNILPTTSNGNPIPTAVSLGNGGQFFGSVLAPLVNLSNAGNTSIDGQVVAESFQQSGAELHELQFSPTVVRTPVPEPATYGAWLLGASVALVTLRSWRAQRRSPSPAATAARAGLT